MILYIIGIIVAIGLISWAVTGDATDVKGTAGAVKDGASSAAGTVKGAAGSAAGTVKGAAGSSGAVASAPAPPPPPPPPPIVYSKYSDNPFWDGGAKLTCPTAVGVNLTGGNKGYADYCIFTGTGAEANAQTACSSISNCVGYVVGKDSTGPMYQLTTMPRYDPNSPHHRFYMKEPLPEGAVLPLVIDVMGKISVMNGKWLKSDSGTSGVSGFVNNPGYHSDIQAFGGDPTMNLV